MSILKCKMCGGDIELSADKTFGTCEFCGSTMTFPKVDDEQRAAMFNRGNHFRRTGEFDKALAVYERIVQEDEDDAEAHWCCALCRFGIEYVEDPNTLEYLPTCHRASFDSFLEDVDYLAAVEHSDGITRRQYQKDAAKIAEVQRGILATSQNEDPFDVFICYKETEEDGTRTRDSLYAQDIYYQLTEQGRRVFFSRITLEDKAGTEYEPYIFAALNSAKVMILVTTSAEHANSVWVKNEWSRFLSLMRKDRTKLLLPCYRDMDPYDLPEALSVLQSYDMGKIGFIQDLIRGVNKVLDGTKPKQTAKESAVIQQTGTNVAPLLERAFLFLEDGDWQSADEYCEKVLDMDPRNARAYLGKLMAERKVRKAAQLKDQPQPLESSSNYQKAHRFADDALKAELADMAFLVQDNLRRTQKDADYRSALLLAESGNLAKLQKAAELFKALSGWRDADQQRERCLKRVQALQAKAAAERQEAAQVERTVAEPQAPAAKKKKKSAFGRLMRTVFWSVLVYFIFRGVGYMMGKNGDVSSATAKPTFSLSSIATIAPDLIVRQQVYLESSSDQQNIYLAVRYGTDTKTVKELIYVIQWYKSAGYTKEYAESAEFKNSFPKYASFATYDDGEYWTSVVRMTDMDDANRIQLLAEKGLITINNSSDKHPSPIDADSFMQSILDNGGQEAPLLEISNLHLPK